MSQLGVVQSMPENPCHKSRLFCVTSVRTGAAAVVVLSWSKLTKSITVEVLLDKAGVAIRS